MLADLLTVVVLAFVGVRLLGAARLSLVSDRGRDRVRRIVHAVRWQDVARAPLVLALVVSAAALLVQVPGLDWGWWSAIGGLGNPVTGSTARTADTALEWVLPLVFVMLLLPGLPLFAEAEERAFRLGCERWSWSRRAERAVVFGLIHAVIGIPIGVALALSIGGVYFQWCYLRGWRRGGPEQGLLESTAAHVAYNGLIVGLLLVVIVLTGLGLG